jgi:cytochrome d ubiquinol oxidase subunit I
VAAEVGRQPWVVHPPVAWTGGAPGEGDVVVGPAGVVEYDERVGLRTVNAVSRAVTGQQVLSSIIGFGLVYALLGLVWLWVLNQKIAAGPDIPDDPAAPRDDLKGFFDAAAERPDFSGSLAEGAPKRPAAPDPGAAVEGGTR